MNDKSIFQGLDTSFAAKAAQAAKAVVPKLPSQEFMQIVNRPDPNLASEFCERLIKMVNEFNAGLDTEHEVGMRLVSFGQTIAFHVEDIGYWNPSLIRFYGRTDNGDPVELIQHVSQISFLLMKVKRLDPTKPKRQIGFTAKESEEEPAE